MEALILLAARELTPQSRPNCVLTHVHQLGRQRWLYAGHNRGHHSGGREAFCGLCRAIWEESRDPSGRQGLSLHHPDDWGRPDLSPPHLLPWWQLRSRTPQLLPGPAHGPIPANLWAAVGPANLGPKLRACTPLRASGADSNWPFLRAVGHPEAQMPMEENR